MEYLRLNIVLIFVYSTDTAWKSEVVATWRLQTNLAIINQS